MKDIHEDVRPQLSALSLKKDRPLVITDADEVVFAFMQGLEMFLEQQNLYFDWSSFALLGNIRRLEDASAVEAGNIKRLLDQFFEDFCHRLPVVPGAAEHLKKLSRHADVIVLSNVPPAYAEKRIACLRQAGMAFPLIANVGSKGQVVRYLTANLPCPAFFIDDIPTNHSSVREHADHVHRLHYIADHRLAKLLGPAEHSHARLDSWPEIHDHILEILDRGW